MPKVDKLYAFQTPKTRNNTEAGSILCQGYQTNSEMVGFLRKKNSRKLSNPAQSNKKVLSSFIARASY